MPEESRFSTYDLQVHLLRRFASEAQHQHRSNVLGGRGGQRGALESRLGVEFTAEQRALAHMALRDLENEGLVRTTHSDVVDPLNWLEITPSGRTALAADALDALDEQLRAVGPHFVEMRRGAWRAAHSTQPDAIRQGAQSGRELISQVLQRLAPDEEVKRQPWFSGDRVTRRQRARLVRQKSRGRSFDSTLAVFEAQCDVVATSYDRLAAIAHGRTPVMRRQLSDLLHSAEAALRDLLLPTDNN